MMSNVTNISEIVLSNLSDSTMASDVECEEPTPSQMRLYLWISYWLEGVAQVVLGSLGFVANGIAIPILLSREMSSIFNRLLTCLAVLDNIFIVCSVLEAFRKHLGSFEWHEYVFGCFLYQFHNMVNCACIYLTVVLAWERYQAVWRPVEYHNSVNAVRPWTRVTQLVGPVVCMAVVFNLPKFFEVTFKDSLVFQTILDEETNDTLILNKTVSRLAPTALRLDENYVLWYSNVSRLLITGIVPFAALAYLNSGIYRVIRRRRRMVNRPRSAASAAQKAEETRQAIVLLVIVVLFLICHSLRLILNIYGLLNLKSVRANLSKGCSAVVKHWTLIGASVSHILLTINSSVNFIIYCFMSNTFRSIFVKYFRKYTGLDLAGMNGNNRDDTSSSRHETNNMAVHNVNVGNSNINLAANNTLVGNNGDNDKMEETALALNPIVHADEENNAVAV